MKITMEAANLADAVARAARVAPTKGAAYDKVPGVVLRIDSRRTEFNLTVQATDLEVAFTQRLNVEDMSVAETDESSVVWRIPSQLCAKLLAALPMGIGKTVTLADSAKNPGLVKVTAGKTNAKLRTFSTDFGHDVPSIERDLLLEAPEFGKRVEQVAWATADDSESLSGVRITGDALIATDRFVIVEVPCVVPVDEPITAPMKSLVALLRNTGDVFLKATDQYLFLSIDADTLMSTTLLAAPYPDVRRVQRNDHVGSVTVDRDELIAVLSRMMTLCVGERYPEISVLFDHDRLYVEMDSPDTGHIEDEIEASTKLEDEFWMAFTPTILQSALAVCGSRVTLAFGPEAGKPIKVTSGDCRIDVMPRRRADPAQVAA